MPRCYFDQQTMDALSELQEKAISGCREDLLAGLASALDGKAIARTWRSAAALLYNNWLVYVGAQKEHRAPQAKLATKAHG
jgi:hypothetical protein